jgi:hypothetical protein
VGNEWDGAIHLEFTRKIALKYKWKGYSKYYISIPLKCKLKYIFWRIFIAISNTMTCDKINKFGSVATESVALSHYYINSPCTTCRLTMSSMKNSVHFLLDPVS